MSGNCPYCDGDGYTDILDDFGGVIGPRPCEECDGTGDRGRRVRMDLSDGAYMDVRIKDDASPETVAALRELCEAAVRHIRASSSSSPGETE